MVTAVAPEIALRTRSPNVRGRYIETAEQAARGASLRTEPLAVLERSVAWLEVFYISGLAWEFIHERHMRSITELRTQAVEFDEHLRSSFPGIALAEEHIRRVLGDLTSPAEMQKIVDDDWATLDWPQMVRSFDAVVAECPIEGLEDLGRQLDAPALAHRARNAYDALRAFVRRHDTGRAEIMRIVGEQYRHGHIRLRDAARLLSMSTSDASFELEQDGFSRASTAISMTEDERATVYEKLRERRLQGTGRPVVNNDLVERDVIASERIEGVDARAWIRRR